MREAIEAATEMATFVAATIAVAGGEEVAAQEEEEAAAEILAWAVAAVDSLTAAEVAAHMLRRHSRQLPQSAPALEA